MTKKDDMTGWVVLSPGGFPIWEYYVGRTKRNAIAKAVCLISAPWATLYSEGYRVRRCRVESNEVNRG